MNNSLVLIIFGTGFAGLLFFGTDLYRMHSIGPRVWKHLHRPEMSDGDFTTYFLIQWILVVICAIGAAVSAAIYVVSFWKL